MESEKVKEIKKGLEKVTEKQEGKGLFQMGYQGATFLSLAHDEDRR